jgi:gliding motility-associated transport system permease protein
MRAASIIFRRELGAYLRSPLGWTIAAIALLLDGILFQAFALGGGKKLSALVLSEFFRYSTLPVAVAAIALAMRLIAEERQTGTIVLLHTSPVRDVDIVLGKFLSAFVFLVGITVASIYMPLLILVHGKISLGQVLVGYLGLALWGAAMLAVGVFASALARQQIVAGVVGAAIAAALVLFYFLAKVVDPPLAGVLASIDLYAQHFPAFQAGVLHSKDVIFYLGVTWLFLLLAVKTMEAQRWQ